MSRAWRRSDTGLWEILAVQYEHVGADSLSLILLGADRPFKGKAFSSVQELVNVEFA